MTVRADVELDRLAADVIERVTAAAPGAEADVVVDRSELALTRFANSRIHQNVADETLTIRLRVHANGRTVTFSTGSSDGVDGFVASVLDAVQIGPLDPGWPGVAPRQGVDSADEPPAASTPADRAEVVRAFVDTAGGLETAGYCREARTAMAFANTAGQVAAASWASSGFDGIARTDGCDGVARQTSSTVSELAGAALGRRAAAKARAATDPRDLAPGRYEVLLEPCATFDVVRNLAVWAFNGKLVNERQSFVHLGDDQFDPAITIVDDPIAAGLRCDNEGTPVRRMALADQGTSAAVTYGRRTAAEADAPSTGHDLAAGPMGPVAMFAGIEPGAASLPAADAPELLDPAAAPLLAGVERGILVSDFWYTRVLDTKSLSITGLTRNGVWLVEHGEIAGPVTNLRFTQAYAAALAPGTVRAVGPTATPMSASWGSGVWRAPALHLASWNFTGGAAG